MKASVPFSGVASLATEALARRHSKSVLLKLGNRIVPSREGIRRFSRLCIIRLLLFFGAFTIPLPTALAQSVLDGAQPIFVTGGVNDITGHIRNSSPSHFYQMALPNGSSISAALVPASADLNLEIGEDVDRDGVLESNEIRDSSTETGTQHDFVNIITPNTGLFYLRVSQGVSNADSAYTLIVNGTDASAPDPDLISVSAPSTATVGEAFSVTITARNRGSASSLAGPDSAINASVVYSDGSHDLSVGQLSGVSWAGIYTRNLAPGTDRMFNNQCVNIGNNVDHLLEATDKSWAGGQQRSMTFSVTPNRPGTLWIRSRVTMRNGVDPDCSAFSNDTSASGGTVDNDQQGWPARRISVAVSAPPGSVRGTLKDQHASNANSALTEFVLTSNPQRTSSGTNPQTFTGVNPGSYYLEGYQTIPGDREFWASKEITVNSGVTTEVDLIRDHPYIVQVVLSNTTAGAVIPLGSQIPRGSRVTAYVTVVNKTSNTPLDTFVKMDLDRTGVTGADFGQQVSSVKTIDGSSGTATFEIPYGPISDNGDFDFRLFVSAKFNGSFRLTDSYPWSSAFRASAVNRINFHVEGRLHQSPPASGTIPGFLEASIRREDSSGEILLRDDTWVVIHGRASSRDAEGIRALCDALKSEIGQSVGQVLSLDWSSAADPAMVDVEASILPAGSRAAEVLQAYGLSGENLHLIGHSWGSYVSAELAERIPNIASGASGETGVMSLVALDPGANDPTGTSNYNPNDSEQLSFSRVAEFSWAFHSSFTLGSRVPPTTAHESFIVNIDSGWPITNHRNVQNTFAFLIANSSHHVGRYFTIQRLLARKRGPWLHNQFSAEFEREYEAEIEVDDSDDFSPVAIAFDPLSPYGMEYVAPIDMVVADGVEPISQLSWTNAHGALSYDVYMNGARVAQDYVDNSHRGFSVWTNDVLTPAAGPHIWQIVAKNPFLVTAGPIWTFTLAPPVTNSFYFAQGNYSIAESGGGLVISVNRNGSTSGSLNLVYGTRDGTAASGQDYLQKTGSITFAPNETTRSFSVSVLDDLLFEGGEVFYVGITNPVNGSNAVVGVTIQDDDVTAPAAPIALPAANVSTSGFVARWTGVDAASGYRIDLATNANFAVPLSGYGNFAVGAVTNLTISGLDANTRYYYRVRSVGVNGTSTNSNTVTVATEVSTSATTVVLNTMNGHYYELVTNRLGWQAAKATAETRTHNGWMGHLVTITDDTENEFVASIMPLNSWIGGFQTNGSPEPNGGWQWVTGETFSFSPWASGEPNDSSGNEHVIQMSRATDTVASYRKKWNDAPDTWALPFVVEYEPPIGINPPAITQQPQNQTVAAGASAQFAVSAVGTGPLSYQWRHNEVSLPGETNSTLTIQQAANANSGSYAVVVSNAAGSVTSTSASLTILSNPTQLEWQVGDEWQRVYGGTGDDRLNLISATSDGGYILGGNAKSGVGGNKTSAGQGSEDWWVVRIDSNGDIVWDKTFGGTSRDAPGAIRQTSDGGFIGVGWSESGISGNKTTAGFGSKDVWVIRLDSAGTRLWEKTFGGSGIESGNDVLELPNGDFIFVSDSYSGVSGNKTTVNRGSADIWVVRLDSSGEKIWEKSFGGNGKDAGRAIVPSADGGFWITAESTTGVNGLKTSPAIGGADTAVWKINGSGEYVSDFTFGGTGEDQPSGIAPHPGGLLIANLSRSGASGNKTLASFGGPDVWLLNLRTNGTIAWQSVFGGFGEDVPGSVQLTPDGGALVAAYSKNSGTSGNKTSVDHGGADMWIIKTDASGSKEWERSYGGSGTDQYAASIPPVIQSGPGNASTMVFGISSQSGVTGNKTVPNFGSRNMWVIKANAIEVPTGTPMIHINGSFKPGGSFVFTNGSSIEVRMESSFQSGTIRYTLDGSSPNLTSTPYSGSFIISNSAIIRAVAYDSGTTISAENHPVQVSFSTLMNGLVAWYPLDGDANDASGNGNHGQQNGGLQFVADRLGHSGRAGRFDGVDDSITITDNATLDLAEFTLAGWIRTTNRPGPDASQWIFGKDGGGESPAVDSNYLLRIRDDGRLWGSFEDQDSNNYYAVGGTVLETNRWYHVAIRRNQATGELAVFLNGVKDGFLASTPTPNQQNQPVQLGVYADFAGLMDDVRIYNRPLTDVELVQLASIGASAPSIIAQPQDQSVSEGDPAVFGVTATGSTPLVYQWAKDGQILTGETNTQLTLHGTTTSASGEYAVIVANNFGSVTSRVALLTIDVPVSNFRPGNLSDGLVAWWKLNESSGMRLDSSGNGNHLREPGSVGIASDSPPGFDEPSAAFLSTASDHLRLENSAGSGLDVVPGMTFTVWFNAHEVSTTQAIYAKAAGPNQGSYLLSIRNGGLHNWMHPQGDGVVSTGSQFAGAGSPAISAGVWYHAAVVVRTDRFQLYLDGKLAGEDAEQRFRDLLAGPDRSGEFSLGSVSGGYHFGGVMKDMAIWRRALSQTEIEALASARRTLFLPRANAKRDINRRGFRLLIQSQIGREAVVEYNDHLGTGTWIPLRTNVVGDSSWEYVDTGATQRVWRFYRLIKR